jgi:AcrR family transcriptional regulator
MARTRTIPDQTIFATVLRLLDEGGDRAVSFGTVSLATGLAPATLAQRYRTRDGMVLAARLLAWDRLDARTAKALADTADKGPQGFLKAIGPVNARQIAGDLHDAALRPRAASWRATVEAGLAARLDGGPKTWESAALLFAAWQGQALWTEGGEAGFRLKDAVKRLS